MITMTAKINLKSSDGAALSLGSANVSSNNISSPISNVTGLKRTTIKPFIIGSSKLGEGSTYCNGVNYFMSKALSDSGGEFNVPNKIVINSTEPISGFSMQFDVTNRKHPRTVMVDGKEYKVSKPTHYFAGLENSNTHEIIIENWNAPNSNLVISGILLDFALVFDKSNLISIEIDNKDRASMKYPSFGIISNSGSLEAIDKDGVIEAYVEKMLINKGLMCEISLVNTLNGKTEMIGNINTNDWDYDGLSNIVNISLKDNLEELQQINVEGYGYDARDTVQRTCAYFYDYLYELTPKKYGFYSWQELVEFDQETRDAMRRVPLTYSMLEKGTLWQQWEKLCVATQCHIYKDNIGRTRIKYNGGN